MLTLLVNRKMPAPLAERVKASVSGRRRGAYVRRSRTRTVAALRFLAVLLVVACLGAAAWSKHRERHELGSAKVALAKEWQAEVRNFDAKDASFLERVYPLLHRESRDYLGDFVGRELRDAAALSASLKEPTLYVRGPIASYADAGNLTKAASVTVKDAFVLCLLDPPAAPSEKLLLPVARIALGGGRGVEEATPNVRRFAEAVGPLPYLQPAWRERIDTSKDLTSLSQLRRELKRQPFLLTKRALRAKYLLALYDEPNLEGGITELDGEYAHFVRVVLTEQESSRVLLRLRRRVDPGWVTPNRRSQYARELDNCRLALDVGAAMGP